MRFSMAALGLLSCALSGCLGGAEDDWFYDEVVFAGQPAPQDNSVIALLRMVNGQPRGLCTGELIAEMVNGSIAPASNYVLTAKHCVPQAPSTDTLVAELNAKVADPGQQFQVAGMFPHQSNDIAVVRLAQPIQLPGLILNGLNLDAPAPGMNPVIRLVGYGATTDSVQNGQVVRQGAGERRAAGLQYVGVKTSTLGPVVSTNNALGTGVCPGDSGGPMSAKFTTGGTEVSAVVGVNSHIEGRGIDTDGDGQADDVLCSAPTEGNAIRVDLHIDFIKGIMAQTGAVPVVFDGTTAVPPGGAGTPGAPGTPGTPGAPGGVGAPGGSAGGISGGCSAANPSAVALPLMYVLGMLGFIRRRRRR